MKKLNLILLLVAVLLGVFTYFSEEIGGIAEDKEEKEKARLIKTSVGQLNEIIFKRTHLIRREGYWETAKSKIEVDKKKLDETIEYLGNMRIQRLLKNDELKDKKSFFDEHSPTLKFVFEKGMAIFKLGKKLDYARTFYMEIFDGKEYKYAIAFDSTPQTGAYDPNKVHNSGKKYSKFKGFMNLPEHFFYDGKIFQPKKIGKGIEVHKISISNFRNKSFSISFKDWTTTPKSPGEIKYNTKYFESFLLNFSKLKGKNIYFPMAEKNLKDQLGKITVHMGNGKEVDLTLYKKYGSLKGYFVKASFDDKLFELDRYTSQIFFKNAQEFWDKRFPSTFFLKDFGIQFKKDWIELRAFDDGSFKLAKLKGTDKQPNHSSFKKLVEFILRPADRVSDYDPKGRIAFKMRFKGRELHVKIMKNEIWIQDPINKIQLDYFTDKELPISTTFSEYFL